MNLIAMAFLMVATSGTNSINVEILTPTHTVAGYDCAPEFMINTIGGTVLGDCATVNTVPLVITGSGNYGGNYMVRVGLFSDALYTNCQLMSATRWKVPQSQSSNLLLSFTCENLDSGGGGSESRKK